MSRRAVHRLIAASLAATAAIGSGSVRAAPLRASLEVKRGAGAQVCPDAKSLAARVEEIAGAAILSGDEARAVALVVEIEGARGAFTATIRISGERTGERILESPGPGCEALGQALAVSIAIVLDAFPGALPPEPTPPTPPTPPRATRGRNYFVLPGIDRPVALTSPEPESGGQPLSISIGTFYDSGTLDDGSVGLLIGADVYFRWLSVAAAFVAIPRDERGLPSQTLVYGFLGARARACFEPIKGSLGIAACSGFIAGQRRASIAGVQEEGSSADAPYVAATFELELSGPFYGPLGAYSALGISAPLLQGQIPIDLVPGGIVESPHADVTFQLSTGLRIWIDP